MKIEFDIDKKDAHVLINALEFAASKAPNLESFEAIQKVIQEIREDIKNGIVVFQELKKQLEPYTDKSPILLSSNFRTQLGISSIFISSNNGLIAVLNQILKTFVALNKPSSSPDWIEKSKIDDAITIEDLVKLILNNYESSH